ncbi:MAG: VOC family protein [Candidatus Geothermarchaeales archaeon]
MGDQIVHVEIPSEDPKKASEFYRELFGWKFDWSWSPTYGLFETGAEATLAGGAVYRPEETGPEMLVYIGVADIPKKLEKVKALGGEVVKEKTEIEGVGWYGLFKDLDGNLIGLFTGKPEE